MFTVSQSEGSAPPGGVDTADLRITNPDRATSAKWKVAEIGRGSRKRKRGKG